MSPRRRKITLVAVALVLFSGAALILAWPRGRVALDKRIVYYTRRSVKMEWLDPDRAAPAGTGYQTFFSPTVQRDVSYLIYLPPGYSADSQRRYPVVYWLHSRGSNQREGAGFFVPTLNAAILAGEVPPSIVVLLNGGIFQSRWLDSRDGRLPTESIIMRDLIPHIDRTYRTVPDRNARAVEGFSMGGFGAAHLGFKYPQVFGVVSMFSAALFDDIAAPAFLEATSPWKLVVRNADAIRGRTRIRMIVGNEDPLLELNRKFDQLLNELNIEHEYIVVPGVGHNAAALYQHLGERAILFYRDAWQAN